MRSMKNVIKLDNYYSPEELERSLSEFINYYNNERYHESLDNLAPADVYYHRDDQILNKRKDTKYRTMKNRRMKYIERKLELPNQVNEIIT